MKVQFNCNSGANIHSNNDSGWLSTVEDLGLKEGEWESMTDDEKYEMTVEYWLGRGQPEFLYEEKDA